MKVSKESIEALAERLMKANTPDSTRAAELLRALYATNESLREDVAAFAEVERRVHAEYAQASADLADHERAAFEGNAPDYEYGEAIGYIDALGRVIDWLDALAPFTPDGLVND